MSFSKDNFLKSTIDITCRLPKEYQDDETDAAVTFSFRRWTKAEESEMTAENLARPDAEPSFEDNFAGIKSNIFKLLAREPVGFDDFPTDSNLSLETRARAYFESGDNTADLQNLFDSMLLAVWNGYREELNPMTFFRRFQGNSAGSDADE